MQDRFLRQNKQGLQLLLTVVFLFCSFSVYSCSRDDIYVPVFENDYLDTLSVVFEIDSPPYEEWSSHDIIEVVQFAPLGFSHQSAAAYGDYVFFIAEGRSRICLYSLRKHEILYTLSLKGVNGTIYHCNQSTFGVDKYDPSDYFPLLYISQRAKTEGRCFIEVYRIFPQYDEDLSEFISFGIELVQTIYLPKMTYENSLGNANCVIDAHDRVMYTYSRNNHSGDDNFEQCKITRFAIPDIQMETVVLEDENITSSFMIETSALYMQGGCIQKGILYIGQGYQSAGYIILNVIDLKKEKLINRIDLQKYYVSWEPEGCFFYDGSVMLAHRAAICRIDKR